MSLARRLSYLPAETLLLCFESPRITSHALFFRRSLADAATNITPARMRYYADTDIPLTVTAAREAMFNWFHASKSQGRLFYRINDLQPAHTQEHLKEHERGYNFLGINLHREDYTAESAGGKNAQSKALLQVRKGLTGLGGCHLQIAQSDRIELYQRYLDTLLQAGQAYHCFCSVDAGAELIASETAQSIRRGELAPRTLPPRAATTVGYVCQDRKCSALTDEEIKKRLDAGDAHVVRFLSRGSIFLHNDLTLSEHTVQQATDPLRDTERDDVVLRIGEKGYTRLWSDVVDDHELEIEIVMRDERKVRDTQVEAALRQTLGWSSPKYAHLPQLIDPDGDPMLDTESTALISGYQSRAWEGPAVANMLALMTASWKGAKRKESKKLRALKGVPKNAEVMTTKELRNNFALTNVYHDSTNNLPLRPLVLNHAHLVLRLSNKGERAKLAAQLLPEIQATYADIPDITVEQVEGALKAAQAVLKSARQLCRPDSRYLFGLPNFQRRNSRIFRNRIPDAVYFASLDAAMAALGDIDESEWTRELIEEALQGASEGDAQLSANYLVDTLRHAIAGNELTPELDVMTFLGKNTVLERLEHARESAQELDRVKKLKRAAQREEGHRVDDLRDMKLWLA